MNGYHRQTTPNLKRLAEKATIFHRHYAGGNFTTPGTATILTGVYPWLHRGLNQHGLVDEAYIHRSIFHLVSNQYNTFTYSHNPLANILFHQFQDDLDYWMKVSELCITSSSYADRFFRNDYHAAYDGELLAFRNGGYPPSTNLLAHAESTVRYITSALIDYAYKEQFPRGVPNHYDEILPSYIMFTLEQAIDQLQIQLQEQPQPFFGYIHYLPPHYPYTTRHDFFGSFDDGWQPAAKPRYYFSEGHSEDFLRQERRHYDEFIAYVDAEFRRLYDFMETSGVLDNTYLIFTSDHGEMFERGIYTHNTPTLYEPVIQIPLLIWSPKQDKPREIFTPTCNADLLPTVLQVIGQAIPEWCEGQALPVNTHTHPDEERDIFAIEARENPMHAPLTKATIAMIRGEYKLIHYLGYGEDVFEFYDLENDPEELEDLSGQQTAIEKELRKEMAQKLAEVNSPFMVH